MPQSPGQLFYGIIALVAFLLGFLILGVMFWNVRWLISLGLIGNFYFTPSLGFVGQDSEDQGSIHKD